MKFIDKILLRLTDSIHFLDLKSYCAKQITGPCSGKYQLKTIKVI